MEKPGLDFISLTQALVMYGVMDPRLVNSDLPFYNYFDNMNHLIPFFPIYKKTIDFCCSQVNFQHWQEGEPNNFNNAESCAEFKMYNADGSGSWNDVHCESYNDWLCEIRGGIVEKIRTKCFSFVAHLNHTFPTKHC